MIVNLLRTGTKCSRSALYRKSSPRFTAGSSLRHNDWSFCSQRQFSWSGVPECRSRFRCSPGLFRNSATDWMRLSRWSSSSTSNAASAVGSGANLTPVEKPPKVKLKSTDVKRLLEFAKPERWNIAGGVSCLVLSSAITMAVPFGLGKVLDVIYATSGESGIAKEKLDQFCMLLAGVFLLGGLANFGRVYLFSNA